MTIIRRDGQDTPFGDWIRKHPALDSIRERLCVNDVDYWIHQYRAHHDQVGARCVDSIMCLEVKSFSRELSPSQRDTMVLIDQILRGCDFLQVRSYRRCRGPAGEKRIVRCFGIIPFRMSGSRPDNSEEMFWRGIRIDIKTLVELLRFERDPHLPSKKLEYRRHHLPSKVQDHPTLFQGLVA